MTDLGDNVTLSTTVLDPAGDPVTATGADPAITLHVTPPGEPEQDETAGITQDVDTLEYDATIVADTAGVWRYRWQTFGTYAGVDFGEFLVSDHAAPSAPIIGSVAGYQLSTGTPIADTDLERVEWHLAAASSWLSALTGQRIALVEDDEVILDGLNRRVIMLPQLPVVDVTKVETLSSRDLATWDVLEATRYTWSDRDGGLYMRGCELPHGHRNVRVTYSHGYNPVPLQIERLVYGLVARGLANPDGQELRAETLGTYSVQYGTLAGGMTEAESELVSRLTMPAGTSG